MQTKRQHLLPVTATGITIGLLAALCAGCATQSGNRSAQDTPSPVSTANTSDSICRQVDSCTRTHGTIMVSTDDSSNWYRALKADGLHSPGAVLEEIVRHSGCYAIASATTTQTHSLVPTARLDKEAPSPFTIGFGSWGRHVGIGVQTRLRSTRAAATLAVIPVVVAAENTASRHVSHIDTVTLTATGEASRTNFGLFAGASERPDRTDTGTTGGCSNYLKSREGRLVTAAFVDAYNQLVQKLNRNQQEQARGEQHQEKASPAGRK